MKKYSIIVASALAALTSFTSCDDTNDCGCACNVPVIESIERLDSAGINVAGRVEAGTYVALLGQNLGDVTSVQFGDKIVAIKPAYRTDNSLILQIPSVSKSCVATLVTSSCPTGYAMNQMTIVVGTPTVYMMYNEFAADKDTLMLLGSSFVGEAMEVDFVREGQVVSTVKGSDIILPKDDGSEMYVVVPNGVGSDLNLVVRNANEGKSSTCGIIFRNTRNLLIDWDTNMDKVFETGAVKKQADGSYAMVSDVLDWLDEVPNLYTKGEGQNKFGVLRCADYESICFAPELYTENGHPYVLGGYLPDVQANPSSFANYLIKFEVRAPKSNPTKGLVLAVGFLNAVGGVNSSETPQEVRKYCAALQMSKIDWDKNNGGEWQPAKVSEFSTYNDKWMTVQIPMSELLWNLESMNYATCAQNFTEGNITDEALKCFANSDMKSYVSKHIVDWASDDAIFDRYGGLAIVVNEWDFPNYNKSKTNNDSHFTIDNVRIVPNDGNGACYPKLKWGTPQQHYFEAPRKSAYSLN
jgi:hypothetical protein